MTRAGLERVRAALADMREQYTPVEDMVPELASMLAKSDEALAILDAELAKPESREWRAVHRILGHVFSGDCDIKLLPFRFWRIESRTPAGPWEPLEVKP